MEPSDPPRNPNDVIGLSGILKARQPELSELKVKSIQLEQRKDNEKYLRSHPELNKLLSLFLQKVLDEHPQDVVAFAGKFFDRQDLKRFVEESMQQDESPGEV